MKTELRPSFAILAGLLIALDPAELMLPFLLAAALHEAGHLIALRLCRVKVFSLRIGFSGAVMRTAPMTQRQEALSAAAGPAVNLLCGAVLFRAAPAFALISLLLACYNLLPVFPLDGGRILGCLCPRAAQVISRVVLMLLFLCGMAACVWLHWGLWPLLFLTVLLAKVAVCRAGEKN